MKQPTICLLGGHLSPAQAVAEYIRLHESRFHLMFIGRRQAFAARHVPSVEGSVMEKLTSVVLINPPRQMFPWNWPAFIVSFFRVLLLFLTQRPSVVVSFGSYVALPGIMAAWVLAIPLVVHEQTRSLSKINRLAARFAKAICVTDREVEGIEKIQSLVVTGFPLRPSLFYPSMSAALPIPSGIPLVLVTGGTTGAVSMNELIFPLISSLAAKTVIVHITGAVSFPKAQQIREQLAPDVQVRYFPLPFASSDTIRWLYQQAQCTVTRSGANTIYELLAFKIPAILLPLPWSQADEQLHLAKWFLTRQSGVLLDQLVAKPEEIEHAVTHLLTSPKSQTAIDSAVALAGTKALVDLIVLHTSS